jgi:hypothetical protein
VHKDDHAIKHREAEGSKEICAVQHKLFRRTGLKGTKKKKQKKKIIEK